MRMRLAFGVIVRLFLPLINGMAKRWQGFRSIKVLGLPRTYHANRSLFTNLFAHAANTLSMSLSSVQGRSISQLVTYIPIINPIISFSCPSNRPLAEEDKVPETRR